MRITLYNPRTDYASAAKISRMPLGLIAIAAAGNLAGYGEITVVDDDLWHRSEGFAERIIATDPDVVGITTWIGGCSNIRELREKLSDRIPIVAGGALPSVTPAYHLEQGADVVVVGDGPEAFVEILRAIQSGSSLEGIPGLYYRQGDEIRQTGPNPGCPTPSLVSGYQYFHMDEYVQRWPEKRGAMVLGSKGCPYRCPFCNPDYRGAYCHGNLFALEAEVKHLIAVYGAEDFYLADGTFTYDRERLYANCRILKGADVSWLCETRADCLDEEKCLVMADSGCRIVYLGLESASEAISSKLRGGKSKAKVMKAAKMIWESGMKLTVFVLFGLPGETDETVQETLDFIHELGAKASPNVMHPIPGTPIWEMAQEKGLLPPLGEYLERMNEYNKRNRAFVAVPGLCEASEGAIIEAVNEVWRHNEKMGV